MKFFKKRKEIYREDNSVYLIRWNLFECKYFSIKLHKILLSDNDCFHDHPWKFISLILWGGYVEHKNEYFNFNKTRGKSFNKLYNRFMKLSYEKKYYVEEINHGEFNITTSKIYHPLNILVRNATDKHKLEIHQPCYTLVLTFKKVREWGFWTKTKGFVKWFDYDYKQMCE